MIKIEQRLLEFKQEVQSQIDELDGRYDARDRERDEERREMRGDYKKILSNQKEMIEILESHEGFHKKTFETLERHEELLEKLLTIAEKNSEGLVWLIENLQVSDKATGEEVSIAEYERRNGRTIPWRVALQP